MTQNEFIEQMERLKIVYGDKFFPEERIKVYWNFFKNEKPQFFENAITNIIAESISVPSASKVKEALADVRVYTPNPNPKPGEFGYDYDAEVRARTPEHQAAIDRAREECMASIKNWTGIFQPLPYDQNERIPF